MDIWTESEHLQETIYILQKIFELVFLQWSLLIGCPWLPARQHYRNQNTNQIYVNFISAKQNYREKNLSLKYI